MVVFPKKGLKVEELFAQMEELHKQDANWKEAKTWSLVYHARDDVKEVAQKAYLMFFAENGLNPLAFPSLKKFETEAVAMTAQLLGGDEQAVGNITSGGTESILLAVKTARDWGREVKNIKEPEMVLPITAHPSFEKASHYFGVKSVHIPLDENLRADLNALRDAITDNTVLIVGSAPCYPYGVIDPIPEMAKIAREHNILFHTDACLGGFMLPFLKKLGYQIIDFDFSVPGVTSISADIHKYGYSGKGASTIIYRNPEIRKYQYYIYADWVGGVYASPNMTGTRPGGAIASAWAVMNYLGEEGYMELAKITMDTTKKLLEGVKAIDGMKILGEPDMSVFAFTSDKVNIYALGEEMQNKGWFLDRQQMPPALHLIVTPNHQKVVEPFLKDLKEAYQALEGKPKEDISGMAALYGMIGTLPDRNQAKTLVLEFFNDLFRVKD